MKKVLYIKKRAVYLYKKFKPNHMNEKTPKNPRGAGREKYLGKRHPVICYDEVLPEVREFAQKISKEYDQQRNS